MSYFTIIRKIRAETIKKYCLDQLIGKKLERDKKYVINLGFNYKLHSPAENAVINEELKYTDKNRANKEKYYSLYKKGVQMSILKDFDNKTKGL